MKKEQRRKRVAAKKKAWRRTRDHDRFRAKCAAEIRWAMSRPAPRYWLAIANEKIEAAFERRKKARFKGRPLEMVGLRNMHHSHAGEV